MDRQVKIRGFRVEPAAIEQALLEHPAVREAVVIARPTGANDRRLVAYVTPTDNDVGVDEVRARLREQLAAHEVPSAFVVLAELPLTDNGKVDHAALPEPVDVLPALPARAPTQDPLEQRLLEYWERVLEVGPISTHDDFFDLGGHSILAVSLFDMIEEGTGLRLPLSTIFEAPTVEQLVAVLRSNGWDTPWRSLAVLTATGSRPPLFFIAAGDGNSVGFGALARRLGSDQPFYVLQPRGLDGRRVLDGDVVSTARHYLREIRAVQTPGPYLLGGRCFGTLVAYEISRLLEKDGERVAVLIALDSVGPLWKTRTLANGLPFDEVMNLARFFEPDADAAGDDIFTNADAAQHFVDWLLEPVTVHSHHVVSRYVHAAYRGRPDLQTAYPLAAGGHAGLLHWSWVGGRSEMGMHPRLLPEPTVQARRARPSVDPRYRSLLQRARSRTVDWLDVLTRGRVPVLARRRQGRLLELAARMVFEYRAGSCEIPVMLIRSDEYRGDSQVARWHGVESGGIREYYIDGTHQSMMREPDVVSLARCVAACVDRVLADEPRTRG
jgi:thioesterase domain-containing protein/acyl carrier protein